MSHVVGFVVFCCCCSYAKPFDVSILKEKLSLHSRKGEWKSVKDDWAWEWGRHCLSMRLTWFETEAYQYNLILFFNLDTMWKTCLIFYLHSKIHVKLSRFKNCFHSICFKCWIKLWGMEFLIWNSFLIFDHRCSLLNCGQITQKLKFKNLTKAVKRRWKNNKKVSNTQMRSVQNKEAIYNGSICKGLHLHFKNACPKPYLVTFWP